MGPILAVMHDAIAAGAPLPTHLTAYEVTWANGTSVHRRDLPGNLYLLYLDDKLVYCPTDADHRAVLVDRIAAQCVGFSPAPSRSPATPSCTTP